MSKELELARKLVAELEEKERKQKVQLGSLKPEETFDLIGLKWKILDRTDAGYVCLSGTFEDKKQFDKNSSNWKKSSLREYLNDEFLKKLSDEVGNDNIVSFERNLLSLDGQTEYGSCEDKVSLLTVDDYRKYRSMIPNTGKSWWWLITPWSTPCNDYEKSVTVVSPSGNFDYFNCFSDCGVRPVCILKSNIFVSKGE